MSAERNKGTRIATVDLKERELDTVQGGRTVSGTGGLDLNAKKPKFIDHDFGLNDG